MATPPLENITGVWNCKSFANSFAKSIQTVAIPALRLNLLPLVRDNQRFFLKEMKSNSLAEQFNLCLFGRFLCGRPTMEVLRKEFHNVGFKGSFNIGWLDPRHILIRFDLE